MATQDWPTDRAFRPAAFQISAEVPRSGWRGFYTGTRETTTHASDRLVALLTLPPCLPADAARREAFLMGLLSTGDTVRFGPMHRRTNIGNISGATTATATTAAGVRSIALSNARAWGNLITRALDFQTYDGTGWTTTNCSITTGVADPVSGTAAFTVTSSASGNTLIRRTYTTTSHADRNATFTVWLKSGTYAGDVLLRIRDGAAVALGSNTITLTSTWTAYQVWAACGTAPAANLLIDIDPVNNAAAAGETFSCYLPQLELSFYTMANAVVRSDTLSGPVTGINASQVRRVATGNHFLTWTHTLASTENKTFTLSVWIIAGSLSGDIRLRLRDGAGTAHGTGNLTPTGTWTRYSLTATFAAGAAANVVALIDPVDDAGAANDSFGMYGVLLEQAAAPGTFERYATLNGGDYIGVGGNLLQVAYAGATGDAAGNITVPLTLPTQESISAGATVTPNGATGVWQLDTDAIALDYTAGALQQGIALPFRQVIA